MVPLIHLNVTAKNLALVVPVAKVPVFLKFVPHVSVKELVPLVVIANVTNCPVTPPEALNVQAPVGVIVMTEVVMLTVIVPVVAEVAAEPMFPPVAKVLTPAAPVTPGLPVAPGDPGLPSSPASPLRETSHEARSPEKPCSTARSNALLPGEPPCCSYQLRVISSSDSGAEFSTTNISWPCVVTIFKH